jgi:thymidine kinase
MFIEDSVQNSSFAGSLEVIMGSMFSGKTEELLRRLRRALFAGQHVCAIKSSVDKRYDVKKIVSHDKNSIDSYAVDQAEQIIKIASDYQVVGIDEAQFFDRHLLTVCRELTLQRKRVIVAGLDMDYLGEPFSPVPEIAAISEHVTKVRAICMKCGNPALFSHRIDASKERILPGEKDRYEPLCRACYVEQIKGE